ncbi:MAG TPA: dihydrofolate reductase [Burkholderiaceae bacterium]|nr:dihydrofolate reductase [Burkholderiaceae bacterium]
MTSPVITLIAARARNGVIGRNNQMPWKIAGEQAYFKRMTMGSPIVMGRKTWESLGRPLPGRHNIVVTRNPAYTATGADVVGNLDDALRLAGNSEQVFVIGGAQLYAAAMPRANRILLTEIDADFDGDTFMPALDRNKWRETSREVHPPTPEQPFSYSYVVYDR